MMLLIQKLQVDLYIKDPDNIIRIILGKEENSDFENELYKRSSGYYNNWINNSIMKCTKEKAFYVWDQKVVINGTEYVRRALIAKGKMLCHLVKEIIP